ncbi:MAG: hypothetical protein ACKVLM_08800, partial [Pseudomonadales bacterium]
MNAGFARLRPLIGRFGSGDGSFVVPARDQKLAARTSFYNAALSSAGSTGFALHGESLFPNAEKVTKNACPCIRVS